MAIKKPAQKKMGTPSKQAGKDQRTTAEIVAELVELVNKRHGDGTAVRMSDARGLEVHRTSTGSVSIDYALRGGIPNNRPVQLWGPESAGKTSLSYLIAGNMVRQTRLWPKYSDPSIKHRFVVIIDAETQTAPPWCRKLGLDASTTLIVNPTTGERAFSVIADILDRRDMACVFIIDSVKALTSAYDLELGSDGKVMPGSHARMINRGIRLIWPRLVGDLLSDSPRHSAVFLNQVAVDINAGMFADPDTYSGGKTLRHFLTLTGKLTRSGYVKVDLDDKSSENVAFTQSFLIQKDKTGGREGNRAKATFFRRDMPSLGIMGGRYDNAADIIIPAVAEGIIEKEGNFYIFKGEKLGNGLDKAAAFLRANQHIYEAVENPLYEVMYSSSSLNDRDLHVPGGAVFREESLSVEEDDDDDDDGSSLLLFSGSKK